MAAVLMRYLERKIVTAGEVLFEVGAPSDHFYILENGCVHQQLDALIVRGQQLVQLNSPGSAPATRYEHRVCWGLSGDFRVSLGFMLGFKKHSDYNYTYYARFFGFLQIAAQKLAGNY